MTQPNRTKRKLFRVFKKDVAIGLGGRKSFTKLFPTSHERRQVYDALLFKKGIKGGQQNDLLAEKYYKAAMNS